MRAPLGWLGEFTDLEGRDGAQVAAALVSVGLEEEAVHSLDIQGPLVVGQVLSFTDEPQKNGKVIRWCQVDVGPEHKARSEDGSAEDGSSEDARGIICGAHNFAVGDKVVVALPGAVLPGPFPISSRKTYGHISDGMICSVRELGIGEDHSGILVLATLGMDPEVGTDAIGLLGLDEQTVEINVTPDRGYAFSIRGIARELAHATGAWFEDPALVATPPATADGFPVLVADAAPIHGLSGCDRFVAQMVQGVDAWAPSPWFMARRLLEAGMRPIALAVDVTNYVMLELGQPLHAYVLAKLAAPIVVRRARAGEHLETLDGVDRTLDPEDLLITDSPDATAPGSRVLGLAGVMGGASSEVGPTTTDILIEAAHFEAVSTGRTSRRHKLSSEAAKRFERGVDPDLQAQAAQMAVDLLLRYGGGEADARVTDLDTRRAPAVIKFDPAYPARVVGVDYSPAEVAQVLQAIGCRVEQASEQSWNVVAPSWRPDLTQPIDLVEEVARLAGFGGHGDAAAADGGGGAVARGAGYAAIGSVLPSAPEGHGLTRAQRLRRSIARSLADFSLVEVGTYPFIGPEIFDQEGLAADDSRRRALRLANPLDASAPLLRTEILQTLWGAVKRNVSRGMADAALYELASVSCPQALAPRAPIPGVDARPSAEELAELTAAVPPQPLHVAGLMVGAREPAGVWGPGRPWNWADAIEAARVAAHAAHVTLQARRAERAPWHPGRCAELRAGDAVIGYAGELHPEVVAALELPARAVAFELDVEAIIAASPQIVAATPVWTQPVAKEDLAFVVDADLPVARVVAAVREGAGPYLEHVAVFDVYRGDQLPAQKKSVAVALRWRAPDHTLTPPELAEARAGVIAHVAASVGGELRS
jgi:phenylalanyl-tRNA synthetase beta chain